MDSNENTSLVKTNGGSGEPGYGAPEDVSLNMKDADEVCYSNGVIYPRLCGDYPPLSLQHGSLDSDPVMKWPYYRLDLACALLE